MVSCTVGGVTSTFTYGADGLRRSMTTNGITTYYAYDGQTMIRELQGTPGSLHATATYLTGMRGPEYRRDDTQTEPDGQGHTYGKTRWYVYDGLGSVVGEVDPAGNVTCSDRYDVYGAVRGRTGTASTAHGFVGSLGHLSDAATGLVYMRARYYDPQTGRFASQDPAKSGTNWFAYCDNNPINEGDSSGKNPLLIAAILISGLISAIGECAVNGWSVSNFAIGFTIGTLTSIAGVLGGWPAGALVGGLLNALDAKRTGGDPVAGGLVGALFGGIGGAFAQPLAGVGKAAAAEYAEQAIIYLMLGAAEGAGQTAASSAAANL